MVDQRTEPSEGPRLSRRDFFRRGLPGRVAVLLGSGVAAAPADADAAPAPAGDVAARDLRKMSRTEVGEALRRMRARRRAR